MSTPTTPQVPRMPTEDGDIWRLSVDRYEAMVLAGVITVNDRVELLEGVMVNKMSKSPAHVTATLLIEDVLRQLVPSGWSVRTEQPIRLDDSEPEPDGVVARGTSRTFAGRHPAPAEIPLVIEVADSSLRRDREDKRRIYARNGITVYWIVNVVDRIVDVYTGPSGPTAITPDYASLTTYRPGDTVPVVLAGTVVGNVKVDDLLP
ncbi:MAG: Uma2 family endonuclease [Planctomycetaceae bacterium]|nr:Uma2 family endonuclease [Planctomycetaceae bacterium]